MLKMAEWDLTARLGKYLDKHMVFPLLEFLSVKEIYNEKEILEGKMELLSNTNMIDFVIDIHARLNLNEKGEPPETPDALKDRRQEVVSQLRQLQSQTEPVLAILAEPEVSAEIQKARDSRQLLDYLQTNYDFKPEMSTYLYNFAKFQYECGNYSGASQYLSSHRVLITPNDKNYLNNLWGKLAAEILMQQWESALEDLNRLKEHIDTTNFTSSLQALQQRTWLIHWSLFVFFNHPQGRELLIEMFFEKKGQYMKQQPYLNAIQTMCPHILRYLTTAVITHRQRRQYMKDLVRVIQQESYTYRDPITEFVECLYVNFDFDGAQKKLRECETVLENDFFLVACLDDFIENARLFIFETFCQIHECISISMLADKLNMTAEEAERWIVNLIRNAQLDAKIDSKLGHVVMGTQAVSQYQQLIEKTKAMAIRTQVLAMNIEKKTVS
ncbi:eukaryotic translation initiation factor 3 subunit E-like [Oppia nitens]|uniref:eukaryotic translation initiation factor 3 subunit E-like n=1 Tax=Oppia nitens TaxID=1686743 RepID=UPI0023DBAE4F|nr:eukaryotic translation initiation factor 3 subunit E-like [Oppia nitens]